MIDINKDKTFEILGLAHYKIHVMEEQIEVLINNYNDLLARNRNIMMDNEILNKELDNVRRR